MKLLEGNVERNPLKLILPVTFGDITTKPQTTEAKINIKHKTLAKQKQQQKKMKRQSIEWDKIFTITYWIKG